LTQAPSPAAVVAPRGSELVVSRWAKAQPPP